MSIVAPGNSTMLQLSAQNAKRKSGGLCRRGVSTRLTRLKSGIQPEKRQQDHRSMPARLEPQKLSCCPEGKAPSGRRSARRQKNHQSGGANLSPGAKEDVQPDNVGFRPRSGKRSAHHFSRRVKGRRCPSGRLPRFPPSRARWREKRPIFRWCPPAVRYRWPA